MFTTDDFVETCRGALGDGPAAVREAVERTVAAPGDIEAALGEGLGVTILHRSENLTVLSVVVTAGLPRTLPHDHTMWAVVGVYGGQEDNHFFRRAGATLTDSGGRSLRVGDTISLGADAVHAIQNPSDHDALAAIHVYGGDLVGAERSMWTLPDLTEAPYDDVAVLGAPMQG